MTENIVSPRSLFATKLFSSLAATILTAAAPTIIDMQKNGISLEKTMFLSISILTSVGVMADKLEKDESVFTPALLPGRNKNVAESIYEEKKEKVNTAIKNVVEIMTPNVAGVAQPIVENVISQTISKYVNNPREAL